jgi:hypothetical protein
MPLDAVSADQLAAIVRQLDRSPIFAMSLGSRELFHSNLLAWFVSHHPAVAEALCGTSTALTVHREKNHTDLLITADGRAPLVIENKVFSLPDEAQLERISQALAAASPQAVLLSLSPPGWPSRRWTAPSGQIWSWTSYTELADLLRPAVPTVAAEDRYAGETLARWLELVRTLGQLVELVGTPSADEPVVLPARLRAVLARARLDAPVQKMRCQQVRLALPLAGVEAGMTRGEGLVQWFACDDAGLRRGWQLQGEQFRLAVVVPKHHPGHGDGPAHRAAREQEAAENAELFAFGEIPGAQPQPGTGFLHYKPGFVYRYVKVPGITFGEAVRLGTEHAARIGAL